VAAEAKQPKERRLLWIWNSALGISGRLPEKTLSGKLCWHVNLTEKARFAPIGILPQALARGLNSAAKEQSEILVRANLKSWP
jgi:hypothetical protein